MLSAHLAQIVLPRGPYRTVAPDEQRVIPPARGVHELGTLRRAEVRRRDVVGRVLGDELDVGDTQSGEAVPPEQPRIALDVEHNEVTAIAGRVNGDGFHVQERAKEVWFEKVGVSATGCDDGRRRQKAKLQCSTKSSIARTVIPRLRLRRLRCAPCDRA